MKLVIFISFLLAAVTAETETKELPSPIVPTTNTDATAELAPDHPLRVSTIPLLPQPPVELGSEPPLGTTYPLLPQPPADLSPEEAAKAQAIARKQRHLLLKNLEIPTYVLPTQEYPQFYYLYDQPYLTYQTYQTYPQYAPWYYYRGLPLTEKKNEKA